jgi:8-oxo-dGTP diphosphatase/2-hydroxy-dATP diphosphatase
MATINKLLTLCVVNQGDQMLLGLKKRGFGEGRWNGFGGKLHGSESIEEAAKRELVEEAGIEAIEIEKRGVLLFEFENNPEILEVHIFGVDKFDGQPTESEEMKPQWFSVDSLPLDQMWPDDRYWMPIFLSGKNFIGKFYFKDQSTIISYDLKET